MSIEDLISQYIDGELPSEAESELHHRLAVSPEARRLFRAQIALHGLAQDARVLQRPTATMRADLFDRLQRDEGMRAVPPVPSVAKANTIARSVPSQHAAAGAAPVSRRRRRLIPMLLPFFIGVLLTGVAFWALNDGGGGAPSSSIAGRIVEDEAVRPESAVREQSEEVSPLSVETYSDARPSPSVPAPAMERNSEGTIASSDVEASDMNLSDVQLSAARKRASSDVRSQSDMSEEFTLSVNGNGGGLIMDEAKETRPAINSSASGPVALKSAVGRASGQSQTDLAATLKKDFTEGKAELAQSEKDDAATPPRSSSVLSASAFAPSADVAETRVESEPVQPVAIQSEVTRKKPGNSLALMAGLQQNMLIDVGGTEVQPQSSVKIGAEFGGGAHQVYGMVARSSYRQTTAVKTFEATGLDGFGDGKTASPDVAPQEATSSSSAQDELWGGLGYRFNGRLSSHWSAGGGVWAGAGENYVRIGAELPIGYQIVDQVRVELLPTVQYVRAYGDTRSVDVERTVLPPTNVGTSAPTVRQVQTTTELNNEREVQAGIGIGISIIIP